MTKLSKSREKYLLEKHFKTKSAKNIPVSLTQFGCRDGETTDEDLFFVTTYVIRIDRLALGGTLVTENGLQYLKKLESVEYLDLRSMALNDNNLDCILHLRNLQYLYIKFTDVTVVGISKILDAFAGLQTLVAEIPKEAVEIIAGWQAQYPSVELVISIRE